MKRTLIIDYSDEVLLALGCSPKQFNEEAKLLVTAKLYELGRLSSEAAAKRADIRVLYGNFQVPVEVKRNMHRDLWSALRNQLIPHYTSAPDTDGYGIYLLSDVTQFVTQCVVSPCLPYWMPRLKAR